MALIVIAGMPDCPKYAHAEYVADFMSSHLPNFNVHRIVKMKIDWENWLLCTNQENNWHHYSCPIVWKELAMRGGRGILIGGLSHFLEYCYEYYGLSSILTKEEKSLLIMDNLEQFKTNEMKYQQARRQYRVRNILISGGDRSTLPVLIGELLRMPCLAKKEGTVLYLYGDPEHRDYLQEYSVNAGSMGAITGHSSCIVVDSLMDGLKNCDIFLLLDVHLRRDEGESLESWLERNRDAMLDLAIKLNTSTPRKCRVILALPDSFPLCFNATILSEAAIWLCVRNIVAVTSNLAFESVSIITKLTGVDVVDLASPPVWGFIGFNQLVDVNYMLYRTSYYVPNKRALKRIQGSTLPHGDLIVELRKFGYVLDKVTDLWRQILKRKKEAKQLLKRSLFLPTIKGIMGLLKLWFSDDYDGEIISLGVLSNGSFGIPPGIFFSQPVSLENGYWMPYSDFPPPMDINCSLNSLCESTMYFLKKCGIGHRYDAQWLLDENEKEIRSRMEIQNYEATISDKKLVMDKVLEMKEEMKILRELNELELEKVMNRENRFIEELVDTTVQRIIKDEVILSPSSSGEVENFVAELVDTNVQRIIKDVVILSPTSSGEIEYLMPQTNVQSSSHESEIVELEEEEKEKE